MNLRPHLTRHESNAMTTPDDVPPVPVPDPGISAAPSTPAAAPAAAPAPAPTAAASGFGNPPAPHPRRAVEQTLEYLARELLQDRRAERRWRIFFRLAWLGLVCALLWLLLSQRMHGATPTGPHTALVELRGEIAADTEASAEQLIAGLRQAFEDTGAQGVVIRINSPGGSPVQAGIVYDEIRRLKAKHQKKVYAVVEEMCASGAYYIAVAADEIYVDKASIVGSIGVLMDGFGFNGLMEKLGVDRRLLTAGENKAMLDPFSPQNARHKAYAQAMIDQIHRQFIAVVKQGRGSRLKETPETFSDLFWNGEEAVKLGLADNFGNLDLVAREVIKAEEVIDYTPKENVAERLAKRFGAAIGEGAVRTLSALGRIR